jgi:hypothetical protein
MKSRFWRSVRCDELIGCLVAFEKKAKTVETCCDHQIEIIDSNDSTSFSIHPAYIRHEHTARQAYRGRSRLPAQNTNSEDRFKNRNDQKLIGAHEQPCNDRGRSIRESEKSGLTVHALDEVVEIVIDKKEEESTDPMITLELYIPAESNENIENVEKQVKLDDDTESSSSALTCMEEANWKINNGTKNEETKDDNSFNDVIPFRNSKKFNELLVFPERMNSIHSGRCKDEQPKVRSIHQAVCNLTPLQREHAEKENKEAVVAFRDPISEVIPTGLGSNSSNHTMLAIGDLVDIRNGRYTNKIGRVIKVSGDLVLVAIAGEYIKTLYVSPSMLRPVNMSNINVIY